MTRDHAASVKARLLGKTKATGDWQDEDPRTGGFTPWTVEKPVALEPVLYLDGALQARWRAYLRAGHFRIPPPEAFEDVGERIRAFFDPVRGAILRGVSFEMHWPAGGSAGAGADA